MPRIVPMGMADPLMAEPVIAEPLIGIALMAGALTDIGEDEMPADAR